MDVGEQDRGQNCTVLKVIHDLFNWALSCSLFCYIFFLTITNIWFAFFVCFEHRIDIFIELTLIIARSFFWMIMLSLEPIILYVNLWGFSLVHHFTFFCTAFHLPFYCPIILISFCSNSSQLECIFPILNNLVLTANFPSSLLSWFQQG